MTRLAYYVRDPGAANVVFALHDALARGDGRLRSILMRHGLAAIPDTPIVWARGPGRTTWQQHGKTTPGPLPDELERSTSDTELRSLLHRHGIEMLVTGVSDADDDTTQRLWRAANACCIPCVAVMDDHDNIAARFALADGSVAAPAAILAVDVAMAQAIAKIVSVEIEIVGDLHADRLARLGPVSADERGALRRAWGVDSDAQVLLFASSCIQEMRGVRMSEVDELLALERLDGKLASGWRPGPLADRPGDSLTLVVRPHPRDAAGKYEAWQRAAQTRNVISRDGDARHAIAAADLVTGTSPAMLREAEALGTPCLSVAPWGIADRPVETDLPMGARQLEFRAGAEHGGS